MGPDAKNDPEASGPDRATEPRPVPVTQIQAGLPYLRRYARALTGNQDAGDRYAEATLEAFLQDRSLLKSGLAPRMVLFRTFNRIWEARGDTGASHADAAPGDRSRPAGLTPGSREALLLSTVEEFTEAEISQIMEIPEDRVADLTAIAQREMQSGVRGKVMIIEDEPLIALDLRMIVDELGHSATGVARTAGEAIRLGRADPPDLILSDIQLADGSRGIDAVNVLLEELGDVPVIFITAFPELLLTGEKPEPALLIPKPFAHAYVRSAISQGMFLSSLERLLG